ncbi:protein BIG GRAIN 1-like [Miscanthus floridulus]|uniref:protein BIG GRAIN 1-like n=1 Tax=Miscanthus floridulus TaxID=154761 RepID=UPI0034599F6E
MERWGDKDKGAAPAPGRARRYADQPSFSSTLLDAIYKSMDEPGDGATPAAAAAATKKQNPDLHYSYHYKASLPGSYRGSRAAAATAPGPHAATTSSSSECSSYGGFSSSEAESSQHRRLRPIRTSVATTAAAAATAPAPALAPEQKKKAGANIRAKLRDLRKPASPGARLAGFLNAIFNGRRAPQTPPSASCGAAAESACSTASSYSRSCLSKTPSTRGQPKRTVRFLDSDDGEAAAAVPARRVQVGVAELEQMLLHRMEMDSDEDDEDEESSDASSDLFDLENFAAVAPDAGAGAAAYRDELPVYETTRVVLGHRAIGHGYAHGRSTRVV